MSSPNTVSRELQKTRPRIGKYVITGRIGKGGMGMVYRGHDEGLDRDVAVKTLTAQGSLEDDSRARFEIEARAAAKLQHPNIVTVFELGEERGMPYIAMELLPGWDLEAILRSGEALLLPEKLDVMIQVCRGLQFAHEHHVVHRDIKPSNIRLLDDGTVKIMDFGIAKLANTHGVTRTGMMVGTVHYMCPEAIQGQPVDGRSDVFSAGVILYELLAGRRPFEGEGATEILYKIVQETPPALPPAGELTGELQDIVARALAKSPAERYPSAAHLADDLAELRQRVEASATPTSDVMESILAARQLVRQGKVDEGVTRLREMVEKTPGSVEARRALRAACREAARKDKPAEAEPEFPELTYQMGATNMGATTLLSEPTKLAPAPADPAAMGRTLLLAGAAVFGCAVVAAVLLLWPRSAPPQVAPRPVEGGGSATAVPATPPPQVATPGPRTGPVAKQVALKLSSEPAGASVTVDGKEVEGKTPFGVSVDAAKPHQLAFSLDGYQTRRVPVAVGASPDVKVILSPLGPPGNLKVASSYPVEVSVNGRAVAKGESPTVTLPSGRYSVSVVATSVFLRTTREVDVQAGGTARLDLPGLGEINIKANPDNCKVFIDGTFVDYPPILQKPVVAGHHTVTFQWTDGGRKEEAIDVESGKPAYVTGGKD